MRTLALQDYETIALILKGIWVFFVFAFGACVGSLTNVLVYRMPRGLNVVTPPSRCPACGTRLTWRENIPILGWILLRGRCRFCKSKISIGYPLVELFVALLFTTFFVLWYIIPEGTLTLSWQGSRPWDALRPDWALNDPRITWPTFLVVLVLVGSLVAMTLIDARTFTIPLSLPWFATLVGLIIHPLHAWWVERTVRGGALPRAAAGFEWSIPTPGVVTDALTHASRTDGGWWWIGASIGAVAGLGVSMAMIGAGLIGRSFADYAEWEKAELQRQGLAPDAGDCPLPPDLPASPAADDSESPASLWIQYPHARREMVRELAFLAPPVVLGWVGGSLAVRFWENDPSPLWLRVLAGVLMGYLIGGGVVWAVRIFGSLAFGKEAMGLGDVHLMAAVGACVGWIDSVLAFFGAAFVGLAWFVVTLVGGGKLQRALPYGPYLAAATVLVLLLKPEIEWLLTALLRVPPGQPPINIP